MKERCAYLMLERIAEWGKSATDNAGFVQYDCGTDSAYVSIMELLSHHGVFRIDNEFKFSLVKPTPNLPTANDLERILYGFYLLGSMNGYGVRFLEEGFYVSQSMRSIFNDLVSLQFCQQFGKFYFWTEKTSNLVFDGCGIWLHPRESIYHRYLDTLVIPKGNSNQRKLLKAISLGNRLGIKNLDDKASVEKNLNDWLDNWKTNPRVWPKVLVSSY